MRIPKIEKLILPRALPVPKAMESFGQNKHNYHPDCWDLEYATYRYLGRMTDDELDERYRALTYNMRFYTGPERNQVPINSYQSSWYWFRKEYHTRLEFSLRNIEPPRPIRETLKTQGARPENEAIPNGSTVIFRYGDRKYMRELVELGKMRVSPAGSYEREENNEARRDDELKKHAYMPGEYTTIIGQSGKKIPVIGDIKRMVMGPQY